MLEYVLRKCQCVCIYYVILQKISFFMFTQEISKMIINGEQDIS